MPELQPERCVAGQSWEWDGVRFTMLHPDAVDYELQAVRSNHMSCVLRIENAFGGMLLSSDIEARDEQALLGRAPGSVAQRGTAGATSWQRHLVDRRIHCRCWRP
jgi:competence protein ComEC